MLKDLKVILKLLINNYQSLMLLQLLIFTVCERETFCMGFEMLFMKRTVRVKLGFTLDYLLHK
jgi:hypothetical protein